MPLKLKLSEIRIDALIVGALVDNMTTMAVMLLLLSALSSAGLSPDEAMARMKTLSGLLLSMIIGLACTGLGGYVAARIAKKAELVHGAVVSVISIALAVLFQEEGFPLWYQIAGTVAMLPAGIIGGYLGRQRGVETPPG